jgi:RNA polymerase sigma-70 factor (ECF subfamily)
VSGHQKGTTSHEGDPGGAQDAWRRFYQDHHPRLFSYVARQVEERDEARAICQEIWKTFFVRFDHYMGYEEPVKGLYAIGRCDIADYWKRRGSRPALVTADELEILVGAAGPHLNGFEAAERRMDLDKALAGLPPRQREALVLHYLDDLRVGVIATLMGVGDNGVKKLLKKALAHLRSASSLDSYRPIVPPEGGSK